MSTADVYYSLRFGGAPDDPGIVPERISNGRALASRRMARACAEILGDHAVAERSRKMVYEIRGVRVTVERMQPKGMKE